MNEKELFQYIDEIQKTDEKIKSDAKLRQEQLAKPPGSLGKLEDISIKYASITGKLKNSIKKKIIIIFSSDNGVVVEGVTPTPQSVTTAQTINFMRRITGVGALAKNFSTDLCVIDMGINGELPKSMTSDVIQDFDKDKIINRKIRNGTSNLAIGPAMTRKEAIRAIEEGIKAVEAIKNKGFDILGVGEMGIGNTTTSGAVLSALTGCDVNISVGRGGGLNDAGFLRKKEIVKRRGLDTKYKDVLDILSNLGGFDICGMVGAYLAAAKNKMPIVIDGYISAVSALVAYRLQPLVRKYMFGSHCSKEPGYNVAMDSLKLDFTLDLDMRLGEGSGCVLAFEIIKGALAVMSDMGTYEEAQIDENYLELMADAKF